MPTTTHLMNMLMRKLRIGKQDGKLLAETWLRSEVPSPLPVRTTARSFPAILSLPSLDQSYERNHHNEIK